MIKKIISSLKYIKISDLIAFLIFIFMIIPSLFFKIYNRLKKRRIWLVIENGKTARDNGYHFFKYMRDNNPNEYCYYVIDKKTSDYNKISKYGNIIQYKSLKHWLYYLSATWNLSNQKNGNPNEVVFYVIHVFFRLYNNRVFLQHGITKDDSKWLYYNNCRFRYFICGAKREYQYINDNFGYPKGNVVYTGFPRFDNLKNKANKNQILIMPTWRNWLGRDTNALGKKVNFLETDYYKYWNSLLNDEKFINFIKKEDLDILFYLHANMQKYKSYFKSSIKNIKIIDMTYDIQKALNESSIMITDYSSVFMDFGYMIKPIIYYQFDYEEYRIKQLQQGYFSYEKDGFGPVCFNSNELVDNFIRIYNNGLQKKYEKRMKDFFEIRDQKNCERIYDILNK